MALPKASSLSSAPQDDIRVHAKTLAERIIAGDTPNRSDLERILRASDDQFEDLLDGVALLMQEMAPRDVHLCTICNVKSGLCSEDCTFCSQSRNSQAKVETYPLLKRKRMLAFLRDSSAPPMARASLVASGRRVSTKEVDEIEAALAAARGEGREYCASLGLLSESALRRLSAAGLSRYHCNLETSRSHFPRICSTHGYDEKLATIHAARAAGMSLCVGALFGMGESDDQILELVLELRELMPEAVPVNFRVPIDGTALTDPTGLSPERCLKIIALVRFVLPQQDILVCGGREQNLGESHPRVFEFGASGIMTGNYLTTAGRSMTEDLKLLDELGMSPRDTSANS